jgi:hypothetical protein
MLQSTTPSSFMKRILDSAHQSSFGISVISSGIVIPTEVILNGAPPRALGAVG